MSYNIYPLFNVCKISIKHFSFRRFCLSAYILSLKKIHDKNTKILENSKCTCIPRIQNIYKSTQQVNQTQLDYIYIWILLSLGDINRIHTNHSRSNAIHHIKFFLRTFIGNPIYYSHMNECSYERDKRPRTRFVWCSGAFTLSVHFFIFFSTMCCCPVVIHCYFSHVNRCFLQKQSSGHRVYLYSLFVFPFSLPQHSTFMLSSNVNCYSIVCVFSLWV